MMINKTWLYLFSCMLSVSAYAADMYGISMTDAKKILKKYEKEITAFETAFQKEIQQLQFSEHNSSSATESQMALARKRQDIIDKISKDNGFLFTDLQVINYPENNKHFTTIEVIDKQHPERMRFVNATKDDTSGQKRVHQPDLIETMINYDNIAFELMAKRQIVSVTSPCPVFHCSLGFDHPRLKPFLTKFNTGAIKERALILDTINHDSDPKRRAAAVFLVGHFRDPHDMITVLTPHIADKDEGVRNNVMRVIAVTMMKAKIYDIDAMPFLDALDSPYTTDRNKALFVLSSAIESDKTKRLIIQKGGDKLVTLLALKQPNNHDIAYYILKKISAKDFGPTNVAAWREWVTSAKNKVA